MGDRNADNQNANTPVLHHRSVVVRAEILNPPKPHHIQAMNNRIRQLISDIGMRVLLAPRSVFVATGPIELRGMTTLCGIQTSAICQHTWTHPNPAFLHLDDLTANERPHAALYMLDVYTCGKLEQAELHIILNHIAEHYEPYRIEYMVTDRERGLIPVTHRIWVRDSNTHSPPPLNFEDPEAGGLLVANTNQATNNSHNSAFPLAGGKTRRHTRHHGLYRLSQRRHK